MCRAIFSILLMLGGMVFTDAAEAAPCVADPVPGVIRDKWLALGGRDVIGCALTEERAVPGHDGHYVQFQNGQVVFSPAQRMVIAAWEDGGANGLDFIAKVDWTVLDTFSYDFFLIRWRAEGNDEDAQHTTDNGGTGGFHQFVDDERGSGHFRLVIEGCDNGGFLGRSQCRQSWSNPVFFDNDYIDISRAWSFDEFTKKWRRSTELPTPTTLTEALQTDSERRAQATARECLRTPKDSPGEDNTTAALARLDVLALPLVSASMCLGKAPFSFGDAEILRQSVSGWIENTSPDTEVGTDVDEGLGALAGGAEGAAAGAVIAGPPGAVVGGLIGLLGGSQVCSRDGDYDFALTLMMPIAFEHSARLDPSSYDHLLDTLLNERGGSGGISTTINVCGLSIDETENHILMTSTARYLTNMLLLKRATLRDPAGTSQAFLDADAEFNNTRNGMQDWMLRHLQNFLKNGFHEFNARPYSRLSMMALQNIANYADVKVATAASMVLDLQGAHFAVSSSQLRRTPPFRRRAELNSKTELFGRYSDQETWRQLGILGTSDVLHSERFGHAPWNAGGVMAFARGKTFGVQRYEQPEIIADLIMNRTTPHTFWQALGHEGYEVYVGTREVFISGGGRWQDSTSRDTALGIFSRGDTDSNAMPTLLVPQFEGVDRNDMIRIDGNTDEEARNNTCVAPGFACGLNPVVPDYWLRRFPPMARPCVHPVIGRILEEWNRLGRENGVIGCPLAPEQAQGSGSFVQEFERGKIGWSARQKMLLSAHYNPNSSDIIVAWHIVDEFEYDFFIVRWDKNGNNIGQRDLEDGDDGTTDTSGEFAITPEGTGTFAFIVEGCESRFLRSSDCDEGFSIPLVLDFPSIRSCARANGSWVFVSSVGPCNFNGMGRGFYAAVYSEPCAEDSECEGQNFGFFETNFFPCFFEDGPGCDSFDEFVQGVLASNGATDFTSAGVNEYQLRFPSKVTFTPDHSRNDSGVINITNMERAVPFLLGDWHLAKGHVIDADGLGCVVVRNRVLKSALVLNMRDFNAPVRSLASSPDGTFSCALVP